MKKLIIISLFAALSSQYVSAQSEQEISVYTAAGFSSLLYSPTKGETNGGAGGEFGVGYTFFIDNVQAVETGKVVRARWGIHSGLGLGLYNATAKVDNETTETKDLKDDEGDDFNMHTKLTDYKETQRTMFLNIPVMALYELEPYYFMAGVKIGIPLSGKYAYKDATLTNEAYYPKYDNWLRTQTFAGLGEFKGKKFDGPVDLGVTVMLSLEAGYKFRINDQFLLYAGAYFDYGLNNTSKNNPKQFINYPKDNPSDFTTNSVLSAFTEKVNIMAAGVKVRLAMNL